MDQEAFLTLLGNITSLTKKETGKKGKLSYVPVASIVIVQSCSAIFPTVWKFGKVLATFPSVTLSS
jgi:hypothetical protein